MKLMRWIITFLIVVHSVVFPLEAFISVQFSLADSNGEPLNGYYNIDIKFSNVMFRIYYDTDNKPYPVATFIDFGGLCNKIYRNCSINS